MHVAPWLLFCLAVAAGCTAPVGGGLGVPDLAEEPLPEESCEVAECESVEGEGGASCQDQVPAPLLPFALGEHMGVTQGPGCGGHVNLLREAFDFNVQGSYESSNGMLAVAATTGTVVKVVSGVRGGCKGCTSAQYSGGWGNHVIIQIDRADGGRSCFYERYAHLAYGSIRVKAGDRVCTGQPLGLIGSTGNSTGDHLHFQRELGSEQLSSGQSVPVSFQEIPSDERLRGCNPCMTATSRAGCYQSRNADARLCLSAPMPRCGNGKREAGEACDGADLGGSTCAGLGLGEGVLACTAVCTLNTGGCAVEMGGPNLLRNGDFSAGLLEWEPNLLVGVASITADRGTFHAAAPAARFDNSLVQPFYLVQLYQSALSVVSGRCYRLSLWVMAAADRSFSLELNKGAHPFTNYGLWSEPRAGTAWRRYEFPFRALVTASDARLNLHAGQHTATLWVDDVTLEDLGPRASCP